VLERGPVPGQEPALELATVKEREPALEPAPGREPALERGRALERKPALA
jgi:hypothetical protein